MSPANPRIQQLLEANAKFAETWQNPFEMEKFRPVASAALIVRMWFVTTCGKYSAKPL